MTIEAFARTLVETVLSSFDRHIFTTIPAREIQQTCNLVTLLLREEGVLQKADTKNMTQIFE